MAPAIFPTACDLPYLISIDHSTKTKLMLSRSPSMYQVNKYQKMRGILSSKYFRAIILNRRHPTRLTFFFVSFLLHIQEQNTTQKHPRTQTAQDWQQNHKERNKTTDTFISSYVIMQQSLVFVSLPFFIVAAFVSSLTHVASCPRFFSLLLPYKTKRTQCDP